MIDKHVGENHGLAPSINKPLPGPMLIAIQDAAAMCHQFPKWLNSLAPGKFEWNFTYVIFKLILVVDGWGISG